MKVPSQEDPDRSRSLCGGQPMGLVGFLSRVMSLLPLCMWLGLGAFVASVWCLTLAVERPEEESLRQILARGESRRHEMIYVRAKARLATDGGLGRISTTAPLTEVRFYRTARPSFCWGIIAGEQALVADEEWLHTVEDGQVVSTGDSSIYPQVGLLGHFLWGSLLFDIEQMRADQKRVMMSCKKTRDSGGRAKMCICVEPVAELSRQLCSGSNTTDPGWFDLSYTKYYVVDVESGRLEDVTVYGQWEGQRVLLFETLSVT